MVSLRRYFNYQLDLWGDKNGGEEEEVKAVEAIDKALKLAIRVGDDKRWEAVNNWLTLNAEIRHVSKKELIQSIFRLKTVDAITKFFGGQAT